MRSDRKTLKNHKRLATLRTLDVVGFLDSLQHNIIQHNTPLFTAPLVDARTARTIAALLDNGYVSARRMATTLNASFETINETFKHHGVPYRLFQ